LTTVFRDDAGAEADQANVTPGGPADAGPAGRSVEPGSEAVPAEVPEVRYEVRIVEALRRIIRALHLRSRKLTAEYDVTGPQLHCLLTVAQEETLTVTSIARRVHLSSSTVIGILDRLESKGLVARERDKNDRRLVNVMATDRGRELVAKAPSPLQDTLLEGLKALPDMEQATIAFSLERIVDLMEAKEVAPAPFFGATLDAQP
jgi:DNA-binding MarR family transcriptional regulator